jgi:putrescine transport system substrate-binding protein
MTYSSRRSRLWLSTVVVCSVLLICACGNRKTSVDAETRLDTSRHEKALNLLIWSGVLAPNTVTDFEKLTGIKVHVSYAASNEDMETRIMTGNSGFDVVGPAADYFKREIQAGAYLFLDKSKLPHLTNMDPQLMREVAFQDPDNAHATILSWGTNGIGYNEKMVKHLMPDAPLDSWGLIFDPAIASRIAKCGIGVVDSGADAMRAVLPYLGRDPNSQKSEDLAAAEATLMKVRPYVSQINSVDYVQYL